MKKIVQTGFALLLAVMTVLVLINCPADAGSLSSNASVSEVTIGNTKALTLGTPSKSWIEAAANPGHVYIPRAGLTGAIVRAKASSGAKVLFAMAKANVEPFFRYATGPFNFDPDDFLYIEVFSENLDDFMVYAIRIHSRNPGLSDLWLGGRSLVGGVAASGRPILKFGDLGKPGTAWNNVEAVGEAWFGDNETGKLDVAIKPELPTLSARIASASGTTAPDFTGSFLTTGDDGIISGDSELEVTLADGDYIYVEVKGDENTENTYYKIKMVEKSSNRTITNARFIIYDGNTMIEEYPVDLGKMGTNSWAGSEAYGNYADGAEIQGAADNGSTHVVNVNSTSIVSLYLDSDAPAGVPGLNSGKPQFIGQRPPANLRVKFAADFEGEMSFIVEKNQRSSPSFENANTTGDFGDLRGFWWWGVQVTNQLGELGWYKFITRIGSEKTELASITINGQAVDISSIVGGVTPAQMVSPTDFATITLPSSTNMSNISVVAKVPAGYQSLISLATAPEPTIDVSRVLFDINQESYNRLTGTYDKVMGIESGSYIYIRVLAELSYLYGGSGFVSGSWQPSRTGSYVPFHFYKIRVIKDGGNNNAVLNEVRYKGQVVASGATVANAKVDVTVTTGTPTYSTDSKSMVIISTPITTTWSTQTDNKIIIPDYDEPAHLFEAVPAYTGASVAYAIAANTNVVASGSFLNSIAFQQGLDTWEIRPAAGNYLVIRITSENGTNVDIYRFLLAEKTE